MMQHYSSATGRFFFWILLMSLSRLRFFFRNRFSVMPVSTALASHARSPTSDDRPIKRVKLEEVEERCQVEQEMALPIEFVKAYEHELEYRNQLVLAPMVRTGSCKMSVVVVADLSANGER
jgi:hypothetical protein